MSDAVESVPLHSTTKERYLNYALSVITSRALPDVRDGLKPVQRRILYGMQQLRLSPDARHTKCAQIVGEVMGKYHPHGDSAIYEALVRMAQSFSLRAPLVDGQGNFGSLDGDTAAAMRYTEAKLFPLATELLSDLSKEIVPFRPTYDGSREEPVVLPAAFPNLLVNGSSGIAVGLATNIPPHDLGEILRACVLLIDKPDCTLQELMKVLPAPDFPTGGRILSSAEEIAEVYRKGRGPIELRGDFEVETEGKRKRIAITSIPYATNKAQLVERIAEQVRSGKLPQVLDVRDESTELVRIVLELRAQADPEAVMAFLFKHTPLQSRFSVNLTCLVPVGEMGCRPQQLGLLEMLRHFLEFRFEVVSRRLALRLRELRERIHILEAFERIFDAIDEAIAIIRASRDRAEAGLRLRERFDLDELQSNAILDTRLYRLAQLEIEEIRADLASKRAEAEQLEALLADAPGRWKLVRSELSNLSKRFADGRRTTLGGPDIKAQYSAEDFIIDEDVYVIVSRDGWLKRQRSYTDLAAIRVREGDSVGWSMWASTRKSLILFTDRGKAYTMRVDSVNATTGYGEPVQARFEFEDGERIVGAAVSDERSLPPCVECVSIPKNQLPFEPESDEELDASEKPSHCLLAMSKRGMVLRLPLQAFEAPSTVNGRTYMRLTGDDRVLSVFVSGGGEYVCLATENARALCFVVEEVPVLKSAGRGVRAVQLEGKDVVHTLCLARDASDGFEVNTQRGRNVMVTARRYPPIGRGGKGKVIEPRGKVVKVSTKVVVLEPPAAEKSEKSDARPAPQATTHDEEERGDELELPFALGRFVAVKRQSSADSDADSDADRESQDE